MLKDKDGNLSAKRVSGFVLVITGILVAVIGTFLGYAGAAEILWPVLGTAAGMLGVTAFEKKNVV